MKRYIGIVILLVFFTVIYAEAGEEAREYHVIRPVKVDISPSWGIPPDGNADFQVDSELLEVPYQGVAQGTMLSTTDVSSWRNLIYGVTVYNLTADLVRNVVLTIENYGVFYGDPTGWIFLYDTVWNPPALADGGVPAYPVGDIPAGGSAHTEVIMIRGCEIPLFDGQFDAESYGFNSSSPVPGFSDASVLMNSGISWNYSFLPLIYSAY